MDGSSNSHAALSSLLSLVQATLAKVPGAPDGLKPSEVLAVSEQVPEQTSLVRDLASQIWSGRIRGDLPVLLQGLAGAGKPLDDRQMLMEQLIQRLVAMEPNSPMRSFATDQFVKVLWSDLPHPVSTFVSNKYRFRHPEGKYNNIFQPDLGAAGTPYARTVPPQHPLPRNLPDPETVFDCLLKRDKFVEQPSGISSMMFAMAVLIVHSCFRTSYSDPTINETSSYLDLSVLYGHNTARAEQMRTYVQGKIHPDTFAEERLGLMPPSVTALLVLFNRNHNYIAEMLYKINEKGLFSDPEGLDDKKRKWQDEELYQTARHVNCAMFIQIVFKDYVPTILGTNRSTSDWNLDPRSNIKDLLAGTSGYARGTGNVASVEFNLLYRWHATISQKDSEWIEAELVRLTGLQPREMTRDAFKGAARKVQMAMGDDPKGWEIPGYQRNAETGRYEDDDLAKIITEAIMEPAGAFRPNGVPECMKIIDCLGMEAARKTHGLCTMNEFRRYFGLKEYSTFLEWCGDEKVAAIAEKLYVHPDNLELYPGILAEQPKPGAMIGSGLATGHTISRAILSDAVALTRGDRFYTTEYSPSTLTNWGWEYQSSNPNDGTKGGLLAKLILRNLPDNFKFNSTFACFPFQTPASMREILTEQGLADQYDFNMPIKTPPIKFVTTPAAVDRILLDTTAFGVPYTDAIKALAKDSYVFMLGNDDVPTHDKDRKWMTEAIFYPGYKEDYRQFYTDIVKKLIKKASWNIPGTNTYQLDYVRDVSNLASVYWMASLFGIPLKTEETPLGLITPQELYTVSTCLFIFVFMNVDPVMSFQLRAGAMKCAQMLKPILEFRIKEAQGAQGILAHLLSGSTSLVKPGPMAAAFYKRLIQAKRPMADMVTSIMGFFTAAVGNQAQAAGQIINVFLEEKYSAHKDRMTKLATVMTPAADKDFLMYSWEGQRLDPQVPAIPRIAREAVRVADGDKAVYFNPGDRVYVSMTSVNMDPSVYPNPEEIDITRDPRSYRLFSIGTHNCVGSLIVNIAQPVLLREVFKLKGVKRAPGDAGQLYRFQTSMGGAKINTYITGQAAIHPFPQSLAIQYEVDSASK